LNVDRSNGVVIEKHMEPPWRVHVVEPWARHAKATVALAYLVEGVHIPTTAFETTTRSQSSDDQTNVDAICVKGELAAFAAFVLTIQKSTQHGQQRSLSCHLG
jgi:TPP-dependent trihydroxycyclohexane-1,2-dione (THcHDO) dehydratase